MHFTFQGVLYAVQEAFKAVVNDIFVCVDYYNDLITHLHLQAHEFVNFVGRFYERLDQYKLPKRNFNDVISHVLTITR